ncbi:MAG: DinB family protein [Balneolaceae bacterium]|nr:DinB family protein [Balneolaceae bacterium]
MPDNRFRNQCFEIFNRLEDQRSEIFARLDTLTDEQLHHSLDPDKWNLLQIVLHVMTGEKLSVIYIKRKTGSNNDIPKSGILAKMRLFLLKVAFMSPFKFKAPKLTDATGKDPDYEKLKSDWKIVREDLKSLIKELDENTLKSELFKHPRVGMLNMKQTLEFMRTHLDHHYNQIIRIVNHPEFPDGE